MPDMVICVLRKKTSVSLWAQVFQSGLHSETPPILVSHELELQANTTTSDIKINSFLDVGLSCFIGYPQTSSLPDSIPYLSIVTDMHQFCGQDYGNYKSHKIKCT